MDVILDRGSTPLTSIKKTHLVWVFFLGGEILQTGLAKF